MRGRRQGPTLRKRRSPSSGKVLAFAKFNGKTISFGTWGPEADRRFDEFKAEWLANGREIPTKETVGLEELLMIQRLIDRYLRHLVDKHDSGWIENNYDRIAQAFVPLGECFGALAARDFTPLRLQDVRTTMIDAGRLCRSEINRRVREIRRGFRWAVANELIPADVWHGLSAVDGLRAGEFGTRDNPGREAVAEEVVWATLPHLSRQVGGLVELMWWTGARPSELFGMTPSSIDRSEETWTMRLAEHKTARKGRRREIVFGPQARAVLRRFLDRVPEPRPDRPLFSPRDAVEEKNERQRQSEDPTSLSAVELAYRLGVGHETPRSWVKRGCPVNEDNTYDLSAVQEWRESDDRRGAPSTRRRQGRFRRERASDPSRAPGEVYTATAFRRAIERGVVLANRDRTGRGSDPLPRWTPYQLRHAAAERIRREFGLEAVRTVLGHASATMSEVYAAVDIEASKRVAESCG